MKYTPTSFLSYHLCGNVRVRIPPNFYLYLKDQSVLKDALQRSLKELISVYRNRDWLDNGSLIRLAPSHTATSEFFWHENVTLQER